MTKKKNKLVEEIELDFNGVTVNRTIKYNFKNNISKSQLYISKKTGTLFHSPSNNSIESLNIWSKKLETTWTELPSNQPPSRKRKSPVSPW